MKETVKNDPDYKAAFAPNANRLSELLDIAKGPERTMAEFVHDCKGKKNLPGVSEPTFSRIRRKMVNRPVSDELLKVISDHSADPEEANYENLMRANGKVLLKDYEKTISDYEVLSSVNDSLERNRKKSQIRTHIKEILINTLFLEGYSVTLYPTNVSEKESTRTGRLDFPDFCDFSFGVSGKEPRYWNFIIHDFYKMSTATSSRTALENLYGKCINPQSARTLKEEEKDIITVDKMGPVRFLFTTNFVEKYYTVFLRDAWEPEHMKDTKNTFVFTEWEDYLGARYMLENARLNTWVSLLLVDIVAREVVEEFTPPIGGKKAPESLF